MRILVTGAAGFFGAHVCRVLAEAGHAPLAATRVRSCCWRLDILAPGVTRVSLDLRDASSVDAAVAATSPDAIVNCAGYGVNYGEQDFDLAYETNVTGALHIASAAKAARVKLVQIGTSYEYGSSVSPLAEDAPLMPKGVYGTTKAAATLLVAEQARTTALTATVLRLFSMYGPLEGRHKIVPSAMAARRTGQSMALSPGGQVRDYVYVGDAAQAVLMCLTAPSFPKGMIVNIASGRALTLRALLEAANDGGDGLDWGAKPYRPDEMMTVVGRPSRAIELIGWEATTTLKTGMDETRGYDNHRAGED